jgi:uncharacterized protein with HEPN domain
MSNRKDIDFIHDILEATQRILAYTDKLSFDEFIKDYKTQDAVIRNLEIIGEAAKKISAGIHDRYPDIPWTTMAKARDRLIHHYFGVNLDIIWQIVSSELPFLEQQIKTITTQGD